MNVYCIVFKTVPVGTQALCKSVTWLVPSSLELPNMTICILECFKLMIAKYIFWNVLNWQLFWCWFVDVICHLKYIFEYFVIYQCALPEYKWCCTHSVQIATPSNVFMLQYVKSLFENKNWYNMTNHMCRKIYESYIRWVRTTIFRARRLQCFRSVNSMWKEIDMYRYIKMFRSRGVRGQLK